VLNLSFPFGLRLFGGALIAIWATVWLTGCTEKVATAPLRPVIEKPKPLTAVPMWLGSAERNFYGTGPWKEGELKSSGS